jgi:D-alanyl-D-alanine carboxypeptidase/D-alanyl-D-alanine-endopeptidase (penicillin-binding protein 4)
MRRPVNALILILIGLSLFACSPQLAIRKELISSEKNLKDHVGFMLYDPTAKKSLIEYKYENYFAPASNVKVFTFYTALEILGDSIPALKYIERNDSLIFWGMGDPSFLYANVSGTNKVIDFFASRSQKIFFSQSNFYAERFGPGWAWEDYNYPFSPERSPFPIYGNCLRLSIKLNALGISPRHFSNHLSVGDSIPAKSKAEREMDSNRITFFPGRQTPKPSSCEIPFRYSTDLLVELLSDTLKKTVDKIDFTQPDITKTLYSVPSDSVYKVMMYESDNLIAEHLLMMSAAVVSDTLKPELAINYMKKNFLADLPDDFSWIDGSGLSRYNLVTPRTMIALWSKIQAKVPQERLFRLLATGGKSGTLKNWYKADSPYIFAKTGTLANNHNLSGFVVTRKGRVLIFSFMNNNFIAPVREVRESMQKILITIRDNY